MNADVVYATLAGGSAVDRIALLDQLPPDDMKGTVAALLASDSPGMPKRAGFQLRQCLRAARPIR